MDILTLGLNAAAIAAIIGATQVLKTQLFKDAQPPDWFMLVPVGLGAIAAILLTSPLEWQGAALNAFIYGAVSVYIYKFGKTIKIGGA